MRILTVEDDAFLAETVAEILTQQHYAVDIALDGEVGWQFAIATHYDLILLDVMLPKLDGVSLCRQLREAGYQTPILLLTAKDSGTDKVMGLDAGADDYVVKPVDFNELTARIRALLRRGHADASPILTWRALTLDPVSLEVTYEGQAVHLTSTEYRLLELFLRNPQHVFSRSAIVEHLWAFDEQPEASTIKTYIKNLRKKLKAVDDSADLIETVYGLGYRLKSESEIVESIQSTEQGVKEQQLLSAVTRARESFRTQICDRLNTLQKAVDSIEVGTLDSQLQQQAVSEAHRFAGALGTFGFETASQVAEAIEDLLQIQPLNAQQIKQIRQRITQLAQELGHPSTEIGTLPISQPSPPQLLIVSQDKQWIQSLKQTENIQQIAVKTTSVLIENDQIQKLFNQIKTETPDAVLLDLDAAPCSQSMGLLSELTKQLIIPILVMTQNDNFQHRIEAARRGAYRFLLKSMSADHILEHIIQALPPVLLKESRILVVEGDRHHFEQIQKILKPWGANLNFLSDTRLFWQTLITFSPHLLILGTESSGLDGVDLCRIVRTDPNWSRLPILFLNVRDDGMTNHYLSEIEIDEGMIQRTSEKKLLISILTRLAFSSCERSG